MSNFMSYKNASVPLEPGLNLIVGPNGAGKSSILLAISVVLGQAYTERARKLSELIRWGEQEARVSIKLDNNSVSGSRPFPQARTDEILLTRILKRKGDYLYLLNNKPIAKTDLTDGLSRIGLNPDNMLVIMHQLMVGRFGSVSPVEKLLLLEDAIGFGDYRKDVLEATSRLRKLSTEKETMASILEGTRETFEHWQREYEKYEMKKKLEEQLKALQRELVWKRILRKENSQNRLKDRISSLRKDADLAREDSRESEIQQSNVSEDVKNLNTAETAWVLNITVGAVRYRLLRARMRVRDALASRLLPKLSQKNSDLANSYTHDMSCKIRDLTCQNSLSLA